MYIDPFAGADGVKSFVREYASFPIHKLGSEHAVGVAFNIPETRKAVPQEVNVVLTLAQTRYLVNSSKGRKGFIEPYCN